MKKDLQFTLTVSDKETGKKTNFNVIDSKKLQLLHPKTNEAIAEISIDEKGTPHFSPIGNFRWPEDAGKCMLECSRGCHGDYLCVAGCAATCSTIIIG